MKKQVRTVIAICAAAGSMLGAASAAFALSGDDTPAPTPVELGDGGSGMMAEVPGGGTPQPCVSIVPSTFQTNSPIC